MQAYISIHALLAESDVSSPVKSSNFGNFYPRSPCGERPAKLYYLPVLFVFLSTLSLRRATRWDRNGCGKNWPFLSTLSLRRATRCFNASQNRSGFLSTLSLRRATFPWDLTGGSNYISIHALLAESDYYGCYSLRHSAQFLSTLSLRRATSSILINLR